MCYRLSAHAQQRIRQRNIPVEWLLAAMDGRAAEQVDGTVIMYDRCSRCALIVNPEAMVIVTVFRLKRKQIKQIFSKQHRKATLDG